MSRKKASHDDGPVDVGDPVTGATEAAPLVKVATMDPGTIINCHKLTVGTVVELTQAEIDSHRSHGIRLDDVSDDDNREVFDVREKYVAKEEE